MKSLATPLKRLAHKRRTKSIITRFAEEVGLVYFGHVDQHEEDQRIIRGMTVSINHIDAHYCIGTYEGYDMAFVQRTDVLKPVSPLKKSSRHRWHIMEFDLHTSVDLPHCFVGLHQHSESFYKQLFTKYPHFRSITLGALGSYSPLFTAKYKVYGSPKDAILIEKMLQPEVNEMITRHFGSLAIEIHEGSLFVYAETATVSYKLLDAMIKNGVWLARHIDEVSHTL